MTPSTVRAVGRVLAGLMLIATGIFVALRGGDRDAVGAGIVLGIFGYTLMEM